MLPDSLESYYHLLMLSENSIGQFQFSTLMESQQKIFE